VTSVKTKTADYPCTRARRCSPSFCPWGGKAARLRTQIVRRRGAQQILESLPQALRVLTDHPMGADVPRPRSEEVRFAHDSALGEDGFELSVPGDTIKVLRSLHVVPANIKSARTSSETGEPAVGDRLPIVAHRMNGGGHRRPARSPPRSGDPADRYAMRVLIDVDDGRLSVANATGLIGVGRRQVYRLMDAFRAHGADGLISRKRGGPSNRALGAVFRETVLAIWPLCASATPILVRPWRPRSCQSFMAWTSASRRCGNG
jgi:Winged helix-turn helix